MARKEIENRTALVQSDNFGGLNTVASPLSIETQDSPLLRNMNVLPDGSLEKRKGTFVIGYQNIPGINTGFAVGCITTGLGFKYLYSRYDTNVVFYEVADDVATQVATFTSILPSSIKTQHVDMTVVNEVEPRLIICHGRAAPVIIRIVEQSVGYDVSSPQTSIVFDNAERFKEISSNTNRIVYINGVRFTGNPSFSYNSSTKQLTVSNISYNGVGTVAVVMLLQQRGVEALMYDGEYFFNGTTRFFISNPDQHVAIPQSVRYDVEPIASGTLQGLYPIGAYKSTNYNDVYNIIPTRNPTGINDYCHSDGSAYTGTGRTTPTPYYITFGTISGGSNPQPVLFVRYAKLDFNGGKGIRGDRLLVRVDGVVVPQNTNTTVGHATYGAYYLYDSQLNRINNQTTVATYIGFDAATHIGLSRTSTVELINTEVKWCGTSADNTIDDYHNNGGTPLYGFGLFADYGSGSFPSSSSLVHNRLVFSGFYNNVALNIFSAPADTYVPGKPYNYFMPPLAQPMATSPFDILVPGEAGDFVVKAFEWHQNVFILSRRSIYRIYSEGTITPLNFSLNKIASVGVVNHRSLALTSDGVFFVSDKGVFGVVKQDNGEYSLVEVSSKVRNIFEKTITDAASQLPWLAFNSANRKLYLGYLHKSTDNINRRFFVFDLLTRAWTEYMSSCSFSTFCGSRYFDVVKGEQIVFATFIRDAYVGFVVDGFSLYMDFAFKLQKSTDNNYTYFAQTPIQTFTVIADQDEYAYGLEAESGTAFSPSYIPIQNVTEVALIMTDTGAEVSPTVWRKTNRSSIIFLNKTGLINKSVSLVARRPVTESVEGRVMYNATAPKYISPVLVYNNDVFKVEGVDYQYNVLTKTVSNLSIPNNTHVYLGLAYQAMYESPTYTYQNISRIKKLKNIYVAFLHKYVKSTIPYSAAFADYAGKLKYRNNANLSVCYDFDPNHVNVYDIYGFSDAVFDSSYFDIEAPALQYQDFVVLKVPFEGIPNTFSLLVWSYDETYMCLAGFQIAARFASEQFTNWL